MSFYHLSVAELKDLRQNSDPTILDIRDPASFASGHIQGAIHLTDANAPHVLTQLTAADPVVVCCYHGHSSQPVAQWLVNQGFQRVYSLDGGYTEWATD